MNFDFLVVLVLRGAIYLGEVSVVALADLDGVEGAVVSAHFLASDLDEEVVEGVGSLLDFASADGREEELVELVDVGGRAVDLAAVLAREVLLGFSVLHVGSAHNRALDHHELVHVELAQVADGVQKDLFEGRHVYQAHVHVLLRRQYPDTIKRGNYYFKLFAASKINFCCTLKNIFFRNLMNSFG